MPLVRYRTIVADPPWPVKWTRGKTTAGKSSGSTRTYEKRPLPYKTMALGEIAALPVESLAADDAHLFLWITDEFLLGGMHTMVTEAWGFYWIPPVIVWHKPNAGLGRIFRPAHEFLVIARRGDARLNEISERTVHNWSQVYENGAKVHSAKPDGALDLIERLSPGPYLELFARRQRLGWDTWGDEALGHVDLGDVA
jgi:N6-adenosine-specific RNA methylase IME4